MNILVTGGAGYIGSHVVMLLGEETKHDITVIDNLSEGYKEAVLSGDFREIDLSDEVALDTLFREKCFDAVIHFAASIIVSESVKDPLKYYRNNTINTTKLINMCQKHDVNRFIFSSTAAVYGEPKRNPIDETTPKNPINPYGSSKLMSEQVLQDVARAKSDFKFVILRYFNVSGCDQMLRIGESHEPETHLIPLIAKAALGKRESIKIYGDDYPTKDGTCIRDYIHVLDLASAHLEALEYLKESDSNIFNCGYGHGYSVLEVVESMKKSSGVDFKVEIEPRRAGDPAELVADNSKILRCTNWKPKYDNLMQICKDAYMWEKEKRYGK